MKFIYPVLLTLLLLNCTSEKNDALRYEKETHLKNIKQLTFGGDNAEAYWSYDNTKLVFQANNPEWDTECDQIFYMDAEENESGFEAPIISTGLGRTTCSYFLPDETIVLHIWMILLVLKFLNADPVEHMFGRSMKVMIFLELIWTVRSLIL